MQIDFDTADILTSTIENGQITLTLGDCNEDEGFVAAWSKQCAIMGIDGFYSVPIDYDKNGSAQAVYYNDGKRDLIIGYADNRYIDNVGDLEPGDRAITTKNSARIFIKDKQESVTLYAEAATLPPEESSMMVHLDGQDGSISMSVGGSVLKMDKDEIRLTAGGGAALFVINEQGVQINGKFFICDTAGGCLGTIGPQIPPVKTVMGILVGPSGVAGAPAANWTISPT